MKKVIIEENGRYRIPHIEKLAAGYAWMTMPYEDGVYKFTVNLKNYDKVVDAKRFSDVKHLVSNYKRVGKVPKDYIVAAGDRYLTVEKLSPIENPRLKKIVDELRSLISGYQKAAIEFLCGYIDIHEFMKNMKELAKHDELWSRIYPAEVSFTGKMWMLPEMIKRLDAVKEIRIYLSVLLIVDKSEKARQFVERYNQEIVNILRAKRKKAFLYFRKTSSGVWRTVITQGKAVIAPFKEGIFRFVQGGDLFGNEVVWDKILMSDDFESVKKYVKTYEKIGDCDYNGDVILYDRGIRLPIIAEEVREKARKYKSMEEYRIFDRNEAYILDWLAGNEIGLKNLYMNIMWEVMSEDTDYNTVVQKTNEKFKNIVTRDPRELLEESIAVLESILG